MRFSASASSIVLSCLFLSACSSLGMHDPSRHDQVPDDVKAQPLVVERAPPVASTAPWPRLGDVPMKPYDFSPAPAYNHYMDEMEYDRDVAQAEKKKVEQETPAPSSPTSPALVPPQFQKD